MWLTVSPVLWVLYHCLTTQGAQFTSLNIYTSFLNICQYSLGSAWAFLKNCMLAEVMYFWFPKNEQYKPGLTIYKYIFMFSLQDINTQKCCLQIQIWAGNSTKSNGWWYCSENITEFLIWFYLVHKALKGRPQILQSNPTKLLTQFVKWLPW